MIEQRLSQIQAGALGEIINVAFGLTADKLSDICDQRVVMDAPSVASYPIEKVARELERFATSEVVSVHQSFAGPFPGNAVLLLNGPGAATLSRLLVEKHPELKGLDSPGAILTEVGNVLLSGCLGVFGNFLQVHVKFYRPRLCLNSLDHFMSLIPASDGELQYVAVIASSFNIRDQDIVGRIVIIFGVPSFEHLIQAVERWKATIAPQS